MTDSSYQQCTKTVMDNIADPNITFDENGVCNYWYDYQKAAKKGLIHGEKGNQKWEDTISLIKKEGVSKKYD